MNRLAVFLYDINRKLCLNRPEIYERNKFCRNNVKQKYILNEKLNMKLKATAKEMVNF